MVKGMLSPLIVYVKIFVESGSFVVKVPISVDTIAVSSILLLLNVKLVGGSLISFIVIVNVFVKDKLKLFVLVILILKDCNVS